MTEALAIMLALVALSAIAVAVLSRREVQRRMDQVDAMAAENERLASEMSLEREERAVSDAEQVEAAERQAAEDSPATAANAALEEAGWKF